MDKVLETVQDFFTAIQGIIEQFVEFIKNLLNFGDDNNSTGDDAVDAE